MDTDYNEEDLWAFTVNDLREILRSRGLAVSGKKADLIDRILTSQDILEKYERKKETKKKTETPGYELPVEIIGPPKEISPRSTSSSSSPRSTSSTPRLPVIEVQPDSTFTKTTDAPNIILGDISWDLNDAPKTGNKDILMGQKLERNSSRLGYIGGKTLYELPKKELDNIIFHNLVAIRVPQLNKNEDGKYFLDEDDLKTFTLKPDTPSGSTLKHVLDSIYRQMFKIPPNKPLKDVKDIYGSVYIEYPFFEGLTKPTISSPSYKLLTSK